MALQKKTWSEMPTSARATVIAIGAVQVLLAGAAWTDLARRDAERVNGSKRAWALGIAVNFVGPIAYFVRGRRPGRVIELR